MYSKHSAWSHIATHQTLIIHQTRKINVELTKHIARKLRTLNFRLAGQTHKILSLSYNNNIMTTECHITEVHKQVYCLATAGCS